MTSLRVRFAVDDRALIDLHHAASASPRTPGAALAAPEPWCQRLERCSLTWVGAFDGDVLVGFVNVCWDGGSHAFVLDTVVADAHRRTGLGGALVQTAAAEATRAGCGWLHVDDAPHLRGFYEDFCGFVPTAAGLLRLR